MLKIQVALLWFGVFNCVSPLIGGCSSQPPPPTRRTNIQFPIVRYSMYDVPSDGIQRANEMWISSTTKQFYRKSTCPKIRPGVDSLRHGVNKFFFKKDQDDIETPTLILINLDCGLRVPDGNMYWLPNELENIKIWENTAHEEWTATYSSVSDLLYSRENTIGFWPVYISSGLSLGQLHKEINVSTTIFSYRTTVFTVNVHGHLNASSDAKKRFKNLPVEYEGNERVWYHFLHDYGTHYYKNAVFGGRLFILISHHGIKQSFSPKDFGGKAVNMPAMEHPLATIIDLLQTKFTSSYSSKYVLCQGGTCRWDRNMDTWASSVRDSPQIIRGDMLPIITLFGVAEGADRKNASFFEAIKNEERHQQFKKLHLYLKALRKESSLHEFLAEQAYKQSLLVKPNAWFAGNLMDVMNTNTNITNEFITFTFQERHIGDEIVTEEKIIHIYDRVCITPPRNWEYGHTLARIGWNIEKTELRKPCLAVFDRPNCSGLKRLTFSPRDHAKLQYVASWRRCFGMEDRTGKWEYIIPTV